MLNMNWYNSLLKPFLNPPDWIFRPVWSVLYLMIFLSLIFLLKDGDVKEKILPISIFIIQLILNFSWSFVFFRLQSIFGALVICLLLVISIIIMIISFYKFSKISAFLLVPYLFWTCFAFYLNFGLWTLN